MLIPKASHLVERVAERLLRSGGLDGSQEQLMRRPGHDEPATGATPDAAPVNAPANPVQRSSLFSAPPQKARPAAGLSPGIPVPLSGPGSPTAGELMGDAALSGATVLPSQAILGQARPPGQPAPGQSGSRTTLLDRPAEFSTSGPALPPRGQTSDPASGLLQGPSSVDAVSLERAGMVDWSRTRTRISEEFRLVQRQIIRSAFGPGAEPGFSNLLLVTSARPGEGKSFMSTNLAGSIARQGDHHVLLVDADSKRDSICYSLGLAQARGLLDLAANPKLDPAPLIVKTPIERLSILPVGRERERSAELFSTKEMTRLIQSLGRRYADRLLILDAPPCLSTSDPAVLAQVVGQILFVVEADRTQRDEIEASLDLIQACPTITLVLNKQQISSRYTFGAYSSYYSS
jgi:protein-tyrosine kinase